MISIVFFCLSFLMIPLYMNIIRLTWIIFIGPRGTQLIAHEVYQDRAGRSVKELIIMCLLVALLLAAIIFLS